MIVWPIFTRFVPNDINRAVVMAGCEYDDVAPTHGVYK